MTPEQIAGIKDVFDYDEATGLLTRRTGQFAGKVQTCTSNGYRVTYIYGKQVKVHKVVWAMHFGCWPEFVLDHIDGDGLNNRIANLRPASMANNAHNRRSTKSKGDHPKGVSIRKGRLSIFRADIYIGNKAIRLGHYETRDEAAHAYNKAAIKLHGDFACLNPIGESNV